jgi:hypothetical protein
LYVPDQQVGWSGNKTYGAGDQQRLVSTNRGLIPTNLCVVSTNCGLVPTNLCVVSSHRGLIPTNLCVVSTNLGLMPINRLVWARTRPDRDEQEV